MIDLIDVSKSYGPGLPAVNHVNLHVDKGEFVFVVGSSGSGKTTMIKLLMKELDSTSGQTIVSGERLEGMKHRRVAKYRRKLGVVFQDSVLDRPLTVKENLKSRAALYGIMGKAFEKRLGELVELLDFREFLNRPVGKLSGGQRRRIDIARALLHKPELLILDVK